MKIYELLNRIEDDALVTLKIKNEFCYQGPNTLFTMMNVI